MSRSFILHEAQRVEILAAAETLVYGDTVLRRSAANDRIREILNGLPELGKAGCDVPA